MGPNTLRLGWSCAGAECGSCWRKSPLTPAPLGSGPSLRLWLRVRLPFILRLSRLGPTCTFCDGRPRFSWVM